MNGTPSISDSYAVLGSPYTGGHRKFDLGLSLVVLTRGPWLFRPSVLNEFHALGFSEILCLETSVPRYDAPALLKALPGLRILVGQGGANTGALVNWAAREVRGDRFLVLWDDQTLPESGLHTRVQRLWQESPHLALVPERRDGQGRDIPSVLVPGLDGDRLKILALGTDEENVDTLFPADYTALYHKHRFLQSGGFDAEILQPFWQKADWGLRSRLWGETLTVARTFKVDYRGPAPVEDQTPDRSYSRFYLRTLAVRHAGDHGVLPYSRFWSHARRTGLSLSQAFADFLEQRRWVRRHRYRYQTDARVLTELWGNP